jgi:hypothetical protein
VGGARPPPFTLFTPERLGWPLLTVETELNGDSKSTNERMKGVLSWFLVGHVVPVQLGSSGRPSTKYFFDLAIHFLIRQYPGQAAVLDRLSLSMYL